MEPGEVVVLPRDPLSLSFPHKYTYLTRKKVRRQKETFKEKLANKYVDPLEWDYSKYKPLLSKFLGENQYSNFKGLFVEAFVKEWFSSLKEVSLLEEIVKTIYFRRHDSDKIKYAKYKTKDIGVVVERIRYLTEMDGLGLYSNGFDAGLHIEVKSGFKEDYTLNNQINRRNTYAYMYAKSEGLYGVPVYSVHVHASNISHPKDILGNKIYERIEDEHGNLIIVELPHDKIDKAAKIAYNTMREEYYVSLEEQLMQKFYPNQRGVIISA